MLTSKPDRPKGVHRASEESARERERKRESVREVRSVPRGFFILLFLGAVPAVRELYCPSPSLPFTHTRRHLHSSPATETAVISRMLFSFLFCVLFISCYYSSSSCLLYFE